MSTVHEKDRDDNERGGKRQKVAIDQDEWARFQEEVLDSVALLPQKTFTQNSSTTIEAEPVLHNNGEQTQQAITGIEEEEEEAGMETRAPKQKAEREAKEEILSRLDEEERAQEEADQRVQALKDRLQRIKEKRKAGKTKQAT